MESKKAVALRYERQLDTAPRVVAKGVGDVAKAILSTAGEANVSIQKDPHLVESLIQLEVNSVIPAELYAVVAEVLAYVYRQDDSQAGSKSQAKR